MLPQENGTAARKCSREKEKGNIKENKIKKKRKRKKKGKQALRHTLRPSINECQPSGSKWVWEHCLV